MRDGGKKKKQGATTGTGEKGRKGELVCAPEKASTRSGRASLTNAISRRGCGPGSFFPFGRYFISPLP